VGQGDTSDNKEEFQKKNCPLALLQMPQKGFPLQSIDRLKSETSLFIQAFAGLLCEGGWLAFLSCQTFGTHCPSLQRMLGASREQVQSHLKANGSELESRKSWSCQASRQGLRHGLKLLSNKQGRLGTARQPASGRDTELHNSSSVRDESHTKLGRELCCSPWLGAESQVAMNLDQPINNVKSNLRSHNQLILGNDGHHQQPTCTAETQTMNNKQCNDCALQRRTHGTTQHPSQRRCPTLLCLGQVGLLSVAQSRLGLTLHLLALLVVKQVDSVTFPEQEGLQQWPDRLMAPMLAEGISRVQGTINPMKGGKATSCVSRGGLCCFGICLSLERHQAAVRSELPLSVSSQMHLQI
jgi:hypothetical protein